MDRSPAKPRAGTGSDCRGTRVADFILRRPVDAFPPEALRAAAIQMLDTVGIAAAATLLDIGRIACDGAVLLYGASDPRTAARIMFNGRRASLAGAAFAAATYTDNLDGHDGYLPTKGHIGVAVVPALAALAEIAPDLSGPEALATLTVGYEVAGRAGMALHATVTDYHTSGAWNCIGVAAMAARLMPLTHEQWRHAAGIAEYFGPRSQMMREIATPTMLHDGSGMGALIGLSAAVLAGQGFEGAPAITLEAPEVMPHWADLGQFWQVRHQYTKPYPVCRWAHAAIDAALMLCRHHALRADDIAAISVNSFHEAAALFRGMPSTTSQAQYSLAFAVATAVLNGRIGVEHIVGAGLRDPEVARLLERIEVHEAPRHSARFPQGRWADVTIATRDGGTFESGDTQASGGPEAPFTVADIERKYMEFAGAALGKARASAIRDRILGLTEPGSRFADLAGLLYDPPAGRLPDAA